MGVYVMWQMCDRLVKEGHEGELIGRDRLHDGLLHRAWHAGVEVGVGVHEEGESQS